MPFQSPQQGVYAFEAIDATLSFIPLAGRRALDVLGWKLSLDGWRSLSDGDRRRIVESGSGEAVDTGAEAVLDRATPPPARIAPVADPDPHGPPPDLVAVLGPARPLGDARWRSLGALDRYALARCTGKSGKAALAYDEIVGAPALSHVNAAGEARMVDIGAKVPTARRAVATARVHSTPEVIAAVLGGTVGKGDVLAVARVAGILAAKRAPDLIPLCHPVQTTSVVVEFEADAVRGELVVRSTVEAFDRTGVEMEAILSASLASITVYDMIKSADRWATIDAVMLEAKSGGKSGAVERPLDRSRGRP